MRTLGIISFAVLVLPFLGLSGCAKGSFDDTADLDSGIKGKDAGSGSDTGSMGNDGSMQDDVMMQADTGNCKVVPPSNVCGLDPQCGCGAMGTCDVDFQKLDGTTKCVQTMGSGMIKSACKMTTDCSAGLTCVFGACRPYCSMDMATCPQPGTKICHQLTANNMNVPNLLICYLDCALDDANACGGANEACVYGGPNETDCRDVTGANMTTCNQQTPMCSPGYVCLTNNTCAKWCKVGGMNTCGNKTCNSLQTKVIINNQEFGICQ
jgi:hypothetical protein